MNLDNEYSILQKLFLTFIAIPMFLCAAIWWFLSDILWVVLKEIWEG